MRRLFKAARFILAVLLLTTCIVFAQSNEDIILGILGDEKHATELAKMDIGAISESEYKWRNFCFHVIMPVFENTRYASPEEGFAGAIGAILEALPGQDQLSSGGKHEINRIKRK